jgi:hypothetical protein
MTTIDVGGLYTVEGIHSPIAFRIANQWMYYKTATTYMFVLEVYKFGNNPNGKPCSVRVLLPDGNIGEFWQPDKLRRVV